MLEHEGTGPEHSFLYHRFHSECIKLSFVILSAIVASKECKIYITTLYVCSVYRGMFSTSGAIPRVDWGIS